MCTSICHRLWMGERFSKGIQNWSTWDLVVAVYMGCCPASLCLQQYQGDDMNQKLKDAACQLIQLGWYNLWSNAAKRDMRGLKKETGCKLLQSRTPKCLWDPGKSWKPILGPTVPMIFTVRWGVTQNSDVRWNIRYNSVLWMRVVYMGYDPE